MEWWFRVESDTGCVGHSVPAWAWGRVSGRVLTPASRTKILHEPFEAHSGARERLGVVERRR
jgi:hypothetical protein